MKEIGGYVEIPIDEQRKIRVSYHKDFGTVNICILFRDYPKKWITIRKEFIGRLEEAIHSLRMEYGL